MLQRESPVWFILLVWKVRLVRNSTSPAAISRGAGVPRCSISSVVRTFMSAPRPASISPQRWLPGITQMQPLSTVASTSGTHTVTMWLASEKPTFLPTLGSL